MILVKLVPETRVILSDSEGRLLQDKTTDQNGVADFGQLEMTHATVTLVKNNFNAASTLVNIPTNITVSILFIQSSFALSTLNVELTELPDSTLFTLLSPYVEYDQEKSDSMNGIFKNVEIMGQLGLHLQPDGKFSLMGFAEGQFGILGYGYVLDQDPTQTNAQTLQIPMNLSPRQMQVFTNEPVEAQVLTYRKTIRFYFPSSMIKESGLVDAFPMLGQDFFVVDTRSFEATEDPIKRRMKVVGKKFFDLPDEVSVAMPNIKMTSVNLDGSKISWTVEGNLEVVDSAGGFIMTWCNDNQPFFWDVQFDPKAGMVTLPQLPADIAPKFLPPSDSIRSFFLHGFDPDINYDAVILKSFNRDLSFEAGLNEWTTAGMTSTTGAICP